MDPGRLGKLTLKVAIHLLRFASAVKCIPFNITSTTELRAKAIERKWERCLWVTVVVVMYVHAAVQIATVSHSILVLGLTSSNALQLVCCSLCMISLVFYENARKYSHEIVACINQLDQLKELHTGSHFGLYFTCIGFVFINLILYVLLCSQSLAFAAVCGIAIYS